MIYTYIYINEAHLICCTKSIHLHVKSNVANWKLYDCPGSNWIMQVKHGGHQKGFSRSNTILWLSFPKGYCVCVCSTLNLPSAPGCSSNKWCMISSISCSYESKMKWQKFRFGHVLSSQPCWASISMTTCTTPRSGTKELYCRSLARIILYTSPIQFLYP